MTIFRDLPTTSFNNFPEFNFVLRFPRNVDHEFIIGLVILVMIFRYEINIENSYVDLKAAFSNPIEIGRLGLVRDIVRSFQVSGTVEILQENIIRSLHFEP